MNELNRTMIGLRPGDVLTHLNCPSCAHRKILVLADLGGNLYDFSVRGDDINIVRDKRGPWRWSPSEMVFKNQDGQVHSHIGPDIEVLEAAGMRQLGWYRKLPTAADVRFDIETDNLLGDLHEPVLMAKLNALLGRPDTGDQLGESFQLGVDLIFGDRAEEVVDERSMRLLMVLVNSTAREIAKNSERHPLEELMAGLAGGLSIMEFGPEGLPEMFRRSRRERREPREDDRSTERTPHRRGNGHDHSAHEHHGFPG